METVAFISTENGDDLIVSFAVIDPADPTGIESLTFCARRNTNTCWPIGSEE